jgi:hypothetical protein
MYSFVIGNKFLFRVALGILDISRGKSILFFNYQLQLTYQLDVLLKHCPENTEILSYLLHLPPSKMGPDDILRAAFKVRLRRHDIDRIAKRVEIRLEQAEKKRTSHS